ncbi:hypothetical protein [Streptomyces sp. C1-2]|uniref:hypothetical protein n=1 Tax=Streptomyces sp. C1-2 TaxID=2720022 RepID=UPI001432402A|nr:hypothetical protein [Streptomyces sp. C1-2]NJP71353.1 hypothetical protein [Streptomyces sp. C1-2]
MKWLILGALLGLLLTIPQTLPTLTTVVTTLAAQPLLVAFVLGAAARPHLPLVGRRTR